MVTCVSKPALIECTVMARAMLAITAVLVIAVFRWQYCVGGWGRDSGCGGCGAAQGVDVVVADTGIVVQAIAVAITATLMQTAAMATCASNATLAATCCKSIWKY